MLYFKELLEYQKMLESDDENDVAQKEEAQLDIDESDEFIARSNIEQFYEEVYSKLYIIMT